MKRASAGPCLHVLATLSQGGNEVLARAIIQSWPVQEHHVIAVLGQHDGPMRPEFEAIGEVVTLPPGWPLSPRALWESWVFLRHRSPRCVISYTFSLPALPLCWLARLQGIRRVVMRVGNPPPADQHSRRSWRWLIRLCRWAGIPLMSCSASVHGQMAKLALMPRRSAPVLNGCHTTSIAQQAATARLQRPPGDPRRVLMVARLDPIKDQATLLRAFAAAQVPGWQLQLVGEGPERPRLETLAAELGLDPAQVFLGSRSDIPELLGQADLFAFSTTPAEGFGIALIEAMAAGLPIIASDVPACREVLRDGAAGELLPLGDQLAWTERLQVLMASAEQRQALAAEALTHAAHYDIRSKAQQWYTLLCR